MDTKLDAFTRGYLEAALWTSDPNPQSGEWSEHDDWTLDNIDLSSLEQAVKTCKDFQDSNREDLDEVEDNFHVDPYRNGVDFWLTRNGHGAGYWDRGYGDVGDRLSKASKVYGEAYVDGPETTDQGVSTDEQRAAWNGLIYIQD